VDAASGDGESRFAAASRREAESVALVLAAEGIAHRVANEDGRWFVGLDPAERARADAALASYIRENTPEPAPPAEPESAVETRAGIYLAAALVAAYAYTGEWYDANPFFERGANDARLVVAGELWRTVTALTLHSDVAHVLGNAFSCAVFASLLMRRYGAGVGGALLLASGALGNLLTSEWHRGHHLSVGASTALFGAIGALAATELVRRRRLHLRWSQAWLPLAGGIGLLAMLGTGRGSDLTAHVMGLASGALVGFLAARAFPRPVQPPAQLAFGTVTLAALAFAWWLALRG
jgi:membrane associated rhomboid family serine protease